MKQLLLITGLLFVGIGNAQMLKTKATCDLTLAIESTSGTNGLGVVFNAKDKVYYTAFAGNMSYPLEVFSESGTLKYSTELGVDARGLWYNASSKKLEGFTYDNGGWFQVTLTGNTASTAVDSEKTYGEESQAVGVYCDKLKSVMFVSDGEARFYKKPGGKAKVLTMTMANADALNLRGPMYTGVKGKEIGLLNYETMEVELYSASTGKKTGSVVLDTEACVSEIDVPYSFRVSYANGKVWVFDTDSRQWLGFSIWA